MRIENDLYNFEEKYYSQEKVNPDSYKTQDTTRKITPITQKQANYTHWSLEKIPIEKAIAIRSYAEYHLYLLDKQNIYFDERKVKQEEYEALIDTVNTLLNAENSPQFTTKEYVYNQIQYLPARTLKKEDNTYHLIGRLYNGTSVQTLKRDIRYILFKDENFADFDIVNAHPVILHNFSRGKSLPTPELSKYVNNRDNYLSELKKTCKTTSPKRTVLMLLNFTEKEFSNMPQSQKNYLKPLFTDIQKIRVELEKTLKNKEEYQHYLKQKDDLSPEKISVTLQSMYCQTMETLAVKDFINHLQNELISLLDETHVKIIPETTTKPLELESKHMLVSIPFFDGVLLHYPERTIMSELIESVEEYNLTNTHKVVFAKKELEQPRALFNEQLFAEIRRMNGILSLMQPQTYNRIVRLLELDKTSIFVNETYTENTIKQFLRKRRGQILHEMLSFSFKRETALNSFFTIR
jgi:uncharacterized protein YerC